MLELITCACFIGLLQQFSRSLSLCLPVCCSFKYNVVLHSHHHSNHLSGLSSQGPLTPLICCLFLVLLFFASSIHLDFYRLFTLSPPLLCVFFFCFLFLFSSPHFLSLSQSQPSPRFSTASICSAMLNLSHPLHHGLGVNCVTLKHSCVCMYVRM